MNWLQAAFACGAVGGTTTMAIVGGRVARRHGGLIESIRQRYLDVLGSIYIYNEHRGYTALERVLGAVKGRWPDQRDFIAAIESHLADERKHYLMFQRWFERRGVMPLAVDRACGHIDRFVEIMFRRPIDRLDTQTVIASDALFAKLCRVISLTERRGLRQVEMLLRNGFVRKDATLVKIFTIIEKDEPSHWAPYDEWLQANGGRSPNWWERVVDSFIHSELLVLKLPLLFVFSGRRRSNWPDSGEMRPLDFAR